MGVNLWLPQNLRPAVKRVAVVFYLHSQTRLIVVGAPENFPAPPGFLKVVCRSASEVDAMSQKMREQERLQDEMTDEAREAFEGPIRKWARGQLVTAMMNARNQINKDFCRAALQKMDEDEERRRMKKISFMHAEAFEDGK